MHERRICGAKIKAQSEIQKQIQYPTSHIDCTVRWEKKYEVILSSAL